MYFSDAEIHPFLDNIKKILDSHGGCWMTADPETATEHIRIWEAIRSNTDEQDTLFFLREKADVNVLHNAMLVRFGHEAEDIRRVHAVLEGHGLKAERIRIAGGIAETKAFSLLDAEQGKAVLDAAKDIAFWKVVSAGTAGDAPEAGHSFTIDDELAGDRLELRVTGRLDSLTAPRLLEVYEKRETAGRIRKVQVDCHALDYISSAGLRVLLMMRKNCEKGVSLTGVNETVREILDQTGISGTLDVRDATGW